MATALTHDGQRFVSDYHLATLSTLAPSGLLHVVAVGFSFADGLVRIITMDGSQKVRNIERDGRATVAQIAGPQWLSIAGHATVSRDPDAVARAVDSADRRTAELKDTARRVEFLIRKTEKLALVDGQHDVGARPLWPLRLGIFLTDEELALLGGHIWKCYCCPAVLSPSAAPGAPFAARIAAID